MADVGLDDSVFTIAVWMSPGEGVGAIHALRDKNPISIRSSICILIFSHLDIKDMEYAATHNDYPIPKFIKSTVSDY